MKEATITPFAKPLYIMTKPVGAVCNLACDYCYYLEKSKLYEEQPRHVMSDELLEKFIKEYIQSQTMPQVLFTWHGGETLMRPLVFYKKALELQKKYAGGRTIDNCIQTNGTLLTDEWCEFFRENNFLVGISIDGPQEFHDEYRKNKMGQPSFYKVMKGINLLKKHGVEWNAMAVVNDYNADYPLDFYRFFRDELDCHYIQFTPIVERLSSRADGLRLSSLKQKDGELAPFSITPEQWGNFLCTIFDEWVLNDVGNYYIQLFDSTLANWVGQQPGVCSLAKYCGHAAVMEFNGDVYACDHTKELIIKAHNNDKSAREKLVIDNSGLVWSIVKRFTGRGAEMEDLYQIGCIGLIKAIDNFNMDYDVKFSTYAVPMIIGEIRRYLRDNNSIRVSRSLRDIAYKAIYTRENYMKQHLKEPTVTEIAQEIGIEKEMIVYALDAIQNPVSLFEPVYTEGGDTLYVMDQISDKKNKEERWIENLALREAMQRLNSREKHIIELRFYEGKTQMEVAQEIGISQAQVSRLEKNALKSMRNYLRP